MDTILFLRPAAVTVEVVTETAELLVIPAYKMHELIDSDVSIALGLFKRAAQILDSQISKILQVEQLLQGGLSRKSLEMVRSRSAFDVSRRSQELERSSSSFDSRSTASFDSRSTASFDSRSSQEISRMSHEELARSASQEISRIPVDPIMHKSIDAQGVSQTPVVVGAEERV